MKNLKKKSIQGYTLVEMLVVAAIIALVLGISASTMKNLTKSKGVAAGIPVAKGIFEEARQLALGTGHRVRVVVYADEADAVANEEGLERFCRYIGVAQYYESTTSVAIEPNDTGGTWRISGKGVYLPQKCYVDIARSLDNGADYQVSVTGDEVTTGTCNVILPGETTAVKCFFFEFNGVGLVSNPRIQLQTGTGVANEAPRLILTSSRLTRSGSGVAVDDGSSTGERDYRGFAITRNGEILDYVNLDDMD